MSDWRREAIRTLKFLFKEPYRAWRRAGVDRRMPALPGGRGWRTAIPPKLHISLMHGLIGYTYRGVPMEKHPVEMALYTRLLWEVKPRSIIEIGTRAAGTTAWLSDHLRTFGIDGRIVSVDINVPPRPAFLPDTVKLLQGDANDLAPTLTPAVLSELPRPWLVIEDASHTYQATLAALRFFDPLLRSGEYIVVEDANMTEMGVDARFDGGPARSIAEFLQERGSDYEIDTRYCDQYGRNVTGNPNGYLRRK
ncbi:MAG TPA: CmcI family methyltransferase [Pseudolabrys sp.]|nr:CmcI family methyltransferase [Pseudolabrys sp.]